MPMITGTTRLYAIVGDPIAHVRVPMVFNDVFQRERIDAACVPIHVRAPGLASAMRGLAAMENVAGFIVTAPHKHAMMTICDEVVGEAKLVGAVNTVRREADGRLVGELFDGRGFVEGLKANGHAVAGRRIFVNGAGGAGNAVTFALARAGVAALTIHNRTLARAEDLATRLKRAYPACEVRVGAKDPRGHDIAVNATSVGLEPGDPASFDPTLLPASTLVAEVIMKPELTPLLAAAQAHGNPIHHGRHMLDCQLEPIFEFLRARSPAVAPAHAQMGAGAAA